MTSFPSPSGALCLGHVLEAAGIDNLAEVLIVRHTYRPDGIRAASEATPDALLKYTREQDLTTPKFPKMPPHLWLVFMADGGRRSRLVSAYENRGEVVEARTDKYRYFDLVQSEFLGALTNRLVVEWSRDTINWTKSGVSAAGLPVVEVADPEVVPFPGFDRVLVTHAELREVIADSRYASWRTALGSVQGIYLIADTSTGKLYVGKADGGERILGRWSQYAHNGHGGNVGLKELAGLNVDHARHFQFSLLRVFGPSVPAAEVDEAESHYKRALMTRKPFGLNLN